MAEALEEARRDLTLSPGGTRTEPTRYVGDRAWRVYLYSKSDGDGDGGRGECSCGWRRRQQQPQAIDGGGMASRVGCEWFWRHLDEG